MDAIAEVGHALQDLADLIRSPCAGAQFDMSYSAVLGMIDRLALGHALAPAANVRFAGQVVQQFKRRQGYALFGKVKQQSVMAQAEFAKALVVFGE